MPYQLAMERTPDSQAGISYVASAPGRELQRAQTMFDKHLPGYSPVLELGKFDPIYTGDIILGESQSSYKPLISESKTDAGQAIMAQIAKVQGLLD